MLTFMVFATGDKLLLDYSIGFHIWRELEGKLAVSLIQNIKQVFAFAKLRTP